MQLSVELWMLESHVIEKPSNKKKFHKQKCVCSVKLYIVAICFPLPWTWRVIFANKTNTHANDKKMFVLQVMAKVGLIYDLNYTQSGKILSSAQIEAILFLILEVIRRLH